ncbi:hypothetical protein [Leifsonia soli]|uniref:DUF559 domain-containing protein n=1 Tax=Leifsonia soli TaxID=582665 RepID=A0A852SZL9_9MICO|nr:hypothetical protein [Leifsonia soli]NYD74135.1 hypothetical protein [Leifsonia soli]
MRIARDSDCDDARLRAFAAHRLTDYAFSHTTAAALYGIPLPAWCSAEIHVSVPGTCRAPVVRGHVGHKLSRWEITEVRGLPVTRPEQTWLDLATLLDVQELVVAGDSLVGGRPPLTSLELLSAAVAASAGRRGAGRARHALERVRRGAESPGETRLRLALSDAGLPEPILNHPIFDPSGRFVARVDLAYIGPRVALEYEGDIHRVDRATWRKDITRRELVEDLGWRMVRITADDLRDQAALVARITHLLLARAPRSGA